MLTKEQKQIAGQIWKEIEKAEKILLHCHPNPDPDSVGSALAMMFALQRLGKQVTVIAGDSELPQTMAHLSGFDQIVPKNYFEIKPEEFDLFLILDSSKKNHISQKGEVFFPSSMRTVVIDHHMQDEFYGQINLVDSNYPAVAQMLFDLFEEWQIAISNEIAVCLMLGLYADTGGFKYPRTTTESFLMAARLAEVNPDFPGVIFEEGG